MQLLVELRLVVGALILMCPPIELYGPIAPVKLLAHFQYYMSGINFAVEALQ